MRIRPLRIAGGDYTPESLLGISWRELAASYKRPMSVPCASRRS
jgi:hypothetical protein